MSWRNWFDHPQKAVPAQSDRFARLVAKVTAYLLEGIQEDPAREFRPAAVAQAVGESEFTVLGAMYQLQNDGVVQPHYGLYCTDHQYPIEVVDRKEDIKEEDVYCEIHDCAHSVSAGTLRVELFFTVDVERLSQQALRAA